MTTRSQGKASAASLPITLKVKISILGASGKTIRFEPYTTVKEALSIIASKCNLKDDEIEDKYTLYVPKGEGAYLDNYSMYIQSYNLVSQDVVEFRKVPHVVAVRSMDGKTEPIKVDLDKVASELLVRLCHRFAIKDPQQYELFVEGRPDDESGLDPSDTLGSQRVTDQAVLGVRKKKRAQRSVSIMRLVSPQTSLRKKDKNFAAQLLAQNMELASPRTRCFGLTLNDILDGGKKGSVPPIIDKCIARLEAAGLDLEGLFRVPGNANEMERLKTSFNTGEEPDLNNVDCHVVSGLLKLYFREMPEPLMTYDLYPRCLQVASVVDGAEQLTHLAKVIDSLPPLHVSVLKRLMLFLNLVGEHSEANKMHCHNIATVFAPNLLRTPSNDPMKIIADNPSINTVTEALVKHAKTLFPTNGVRGDFATVTTSHLAQSEVELDLEQGDIVGILSRDEEGWFRGQLNGKEGLFPPVAVDQNNQQAEETYDEFENNEGYYEGWEESPNNYEPEFNVGDIEVPSSADAYSYYSEETPRTEESQSTQSFDDGKKALELQLENEIAHRKVLQHDVAILVEEVTYLRDVLENEIRSRVEFENFVKTELLSIYQKYQQSKGNDTA